VLRRLIFTSLPFLLVGGPRSAPLIPIYAESVRVTATPVSLRRDDPAVTRVGALTLLGGWRLASPSPQFGGWSALHVTETERGHDIVAVGDAGSLVRFRLGRFGRVSNAGIAPLPNGCGATDDKRFRDSESLTGDRHGWWIGYEWNNRICRLSGDLTRATGVIAPKAMANWSKIGGPEAILRLTDGRFLAFAERVADGGTANPLLVFAGDPVTQSDAVVRLRYRPPEGFLPTDAAELPDGRVLVLNRRFSIADLFTTALTIIDPATFAPGTVVTGVEVARLAPPLLHDNFEGVAVTTEHGAPIVWLVSDDNSMSWQATYLLKLLLTPPLKRPQP